MDIIEKLQTKKAWGCKEIIALDNTYGVILNKGMKDLDKTTMSTPDLIDMLYNYIAYKVNYNYPTDFEETLSALDKTMMSKNDLTDVLISFLDARHEEHPSLESVLDSVTNELKSNNSLKQTIFNFKLFFIRANL